MRNWAAAAPGRQSVLAAGALALLLALALATAWPGGQRGLALPPFLSGEEDTLGAVRQARQAVAAAEPEFQAAQAGAAPALQQLAALAPASSLPGAGRGSGGEVAAEQAAADSGPALARLARAAGAYQAALRGYDDALMARSRGLGAKSEQLRPATWPVVEYVKRFPPPLGLDTSLHPADAAQLSALATALAADARPGAAPATVGADLARYAAAARATARVAGFLPEYGRLLDAYAVQVERVAAQPQPPATGRALAGRAAAGMLLAPLLAGATLLPVTWRARRRAPWEPQT